MKSFRSAEISVGGLLNHRDFVPFLRINVFQNFSLISAVIRPQKLKSESFSSKISKTLFRQWALKCRCGGSRPKFFFVWEFFYRKFVKKHFLGRGPQKSTILGLFSKIDVRNFCQLGKNVFFVLPIFSKSRGNGGLFWGVRPKIFSTKTD